jgi:hypothetical protein
MNRNSIKTKPGNCPHVSRLVTEKNQYADPTLINAVTGIADSLSELE